MGLGVRRVEGNGIGVILSKSQRRYGSDAPVIPDNSHLMFDNSHLIFAFFKGILMKVHHRVH